MMTDRAMKKLIPYTAPSWAGKLSLHHVPSHKVDLIMTPTPVDDWSMPDVDQKKYNLTIKRDDLTGCSLSGSKIRKIEFLLADALKKGCKHIITCGAVQSNHCRATAVACAQLGLKCHLFLQTHGESEKAASDGNMFMDVISGASLYMVEDSSGSFLDDMSKITNLMKEQAQKIKSETGDDSYLIPIGGSDEIGIWGYIAAFDEIHKQVGNTVDDMVCSCATGGTSAGLAVANYLAGSPYRIHAICACDDESKFHHHINEMLDKLELKNIRSSEILTIHEQYTGLGYAKSSPQEQEFICRVAQTTGMILDSCYSAKAAYGLRDLLMTNSNCFKGNNVMFIHTGGLMLIHANPVRDELFKTALRTKNEK